MDSFFLNDWLVIVLNRWAVSNPLLTKLTVFSAVYLGWFLVIGLLIYWQRSSRPWPALRTAFYSLLTGLLALSIADLLKTFYPSVRPYLAIPGVMALFTPGDIGAFPSSHAAFFGGIALAFYQANRKLGKWFLVLAGLVCLARVAAGVHYPLDILGGLFLAYLAARLWRFLAGRF